MCEGKEKLALKPDILPDVSDTQLTAIGNFITTKQEQKAERTRRIFILLKHLQTTELNLREAFQHFSPTLTPLAKGVGGPCPLVRRPGHITIIGSKSGKKLEILICFFRTYDTLKLI